MKYNTAFHVLDARDGVAFLVLLWITAADQHDADGSTLVKGYGAGVQVALCHTLEQVYDVRFQTQHDTLRLWVAHTAVVLDDHRLALDVDQSEEDETLVHDAFSLQTLYGRTDNALLHLLHPLLRGEGYRTDAAHAARVQTGVVLANALVVLGFGQNLVVVAVSQHEDRALDAAEELLDDHTARRIAEHAAQHLLQLLFSLLQRRQYQHTLTGT